jgi:hypothetical protein
MTGEVVDSELVEVAALPSGAVTVDVEAFGTEEDAMTDVTGGVSVAVLFVVDVAADVALSDVDATATDVEAVSVSGVDELVSTALEDVAWVTSADAVEVAMTGTGPKS